MSENQIPKLCPLDTTLETSVAKCVTGIVMRIGLKED